LDSTAKEPLPGRPRRRRRLIVAFLAVVAGGVLVVAGANLYVLSRGSATIYPDATSAAPSETAIVPGALVNADGTMSQMLDDRVRQAANLWRAGKVERILVSGDHGAWKYDEPTTMRLALTQMGVPARIIFTDHAGFNTRATMERARRIFGVDDALIVTQDFHMKRALFLADSAGLDAEGVSSDFHDYGSQGLRSGVREVASRVKAVGDVIIGSDVVGGPRIPIDGPAYASWGPSPPQGTPPAGAPAP
jgi:SanA protein